MGQAASSLDKLSQSANISQALLQKLAGVQALLTNNFSDVALSLDS
jgi:hypothetical protein